MTVLHTPDIPMMGFPEEKYVCSTIHVSYYTCVLGGHKVFAYAPSGFGRDGKEIVYIELAPPDAKFLLLENGMNRRQVYKAPKDPLILHALIRDVTSKGSDKDKWDEYKTTWASKA